MCKQCTHRYLDLFPLFYQYSITPPGYNRDDLGSKMSQFSSGRCKMRWSGQPMEYKKFPPSPKRVEVQKNTPA